MAVPEKSLADWRTATATPEQIVATGRIPTHIPQANLTSVQLAAVFLWSKGYRVPYIAKRLQNEIRFASKAKTKEEHLKKCRTRVRTWSRTQKFRDALYDLALVDTDLALPDILRGIVKMGKRGRVDAARLALEVTARHSPKEVAAPANVMVVFDGLPRPKGRPIMADMELEAEEVEAE